MSVANPEHTKGRVLVVDDDRGVRTAVARALGYEGYCVDSADDGVAALAAHAGSPADAIVLDVAMPRLGGVDLCRQLRAAGDRTPILMLTARTAVADRVSGLDAGADDYLTKPFALEELLARVRALLRRVAEPDGLLRFADLSLNPAARTCERGGERIELTRTEFNLLELFLLNPNRVLTRDMLLDRIWGYDFDTTSNTLDVYVGYLRRKTESGGRGRLVHTVRGVGYVLREP